MGFFRELGTKMDNKIYRTKDWIREKHLTSFYYKWRFYFFMPSKVEKEGIEEERTFEVLDQLLEMGQIYQWQHVKLKEYFKEYYKNKEE